MNKMVHQIPVLRQEVGLGGTVVIRSEQGRESRIRVEGCNNSAESVRLHANIGVDEKE